LPQPKVLRRLFAAPFALDQEDHAMPKTQSKPTDSGVVVLDADDIADFHSDHRLWLSEDALWRDEIRVWQEEMKRALADLKQLGIALKAHRQTLQAQASTIRLHELSHKVHEHDLVLIEQGKHADHPDSHERELAEHGQQRTNQERLKRQHHTIMAHWDLLCQALGAEREPLRQAQSRRAGRS
jgi:hypothetical protein